MSNEQGVKQARKEEEGTRVMKIKSKGVEKEEGRRKGKRGKVVTVV